MSITSARILPGFAVCRHSTTCKVSTKTQCILSVSRPSFRSRRSRYPARNRRFRLADGSIDASNTS
ncbi:hypothetical protein WN55_07485 [Dufourea novaeangliae]|uniref:Uncharacterized protein n=1 Tax=Dufourea novaeangliae TaxID=178035 RepID=A0A154PS42_DUFNO|nr:hypothetical protein WN55_07485 [Dufourea novaeangliae]